MTAPILVTGGAGYIGSHTVRLLASQGRKVVVLDNLVYGHREAIVDDSVELVVGEIGDPVLVRDLFARHRFGAVVHFAAYAYVGESVTDPLKYYRNNTAEPLNLLEAMQEHGCKNFVFSSTCATYGVPQSVPISESNPQDPINPYGRSKLMLEWILADCDRAWGLKSACLRYFNASGSSEDGLIGEDHDPETHLIPRVLMAVTGEISHVDVFGTDYPTPDGTGVRDYIHVADLASAHAKALDYLAAGGESLRCNLGTGIGVSVKEIISAVEEITGKKVPVQYGPRRACDPPELLADPRLAAEVLGWVAEHRDVRDMVRPAWAWVSGPRGGRYSDRTGRATGIRDVNTFRLQIPPSAATDSENQTAMTSRPTRIPGGFSLIELLVVILIISLLLTLGAVGLRGIGGKGVTTAVTTTEAVFDEARAIAVGKGTKSRVLIDINDINNLDTYKRRVLIAYEELDEQGEPIKDKWVLASRAVTLPERTYFSQTYSKEDHKAGSGELKEMDLAINKTSFDGKYLFYEFNSEGICSKPGASFVIGTGVRPDGQEPRVTGEGKRDFAGFVVWRNGRTSLFRGPDEIGIPTDVTNF